MSEPAGEPAPPRYHWFQKVSAVLFIVFCLELGLFLVIYPWTSEWEQNLFSTLLTLQVPGWNDWWQSPYLRGALSGLGFLDLYISIGEIFRLRRFSRGA